MKATTFVNILACVLSTSTLAAPFATLDGRLFVDGVGVDDVVDVSIDVTDDTGASRLSAAENGVIVVDGAFAIDVDLQAFIEDLVVGEVMTLELAFDELVATATIGMAFSSKSASQAGRASVADVAGHLGTIAPASLIQVPTLQTAGAVTIAFGNLTGVPTGIADGIDQGNVDGVGAGLEIAAGTLRLTAIGSPNILDLSVPTAAFAANTLTGSNLSGLTSTDVAAASITGLKVADGIVTSISGVDGVQRAIYRITDPACDRTAPLTTSPVCVRRSCTQSGGGAGRITCDTTTTCGSTSGPTCGNERLGHVLFERQD